MPASRTISPKSREHLQEAYENYCRYKKFLDDKENLNWAIVLLFYSAVHLVNAYAATKDPYTRFTSHQDRDKYININIKSIYEIYRRLEVASRSARYDLARYDRNRTVRFHDETFNRIRIELKTLGFEWEVPIISPETEVPKADVDRSIQAEKDAEGQK